MKLFKKITKIILFSFSVSAFLSHAEESHIETSNLVKAGGKNVILIGEQVNVGEPAPNFKVVDVNFSPVMLSDYQGKLVLLSIVPSLDTGICSLQTKRFNESSAKLSDDIIMLTVSNDLPFAQKRFCKTENIDKVITLSDAVWRDLGHKYGLLIKDMGLLTRAIFIINKEGNIVYKELVNDIAKHPDYEKAISTLTNLSQLNAQELGAQTLTDSTKVSDSTPTQNK